MQSMPESMPDLSAFRASLSSLKYNRALGKPEMKSESNK
jgi:hypothetical protein